MAGLSTTKPYDTRMVLAAFAFGPALKFKLRLVFQQVRVAMRQLFEIPSFLRS